MARPPIVWLLRIAVSAVFGIFSLLLIALWVRSYQQCEYLSHIRSGNRLIILGSNAGTAYLLRKTIPGRFSPPLVHGWKYNVTVVNPMVNRLQKAAGETLIRISYRLPFAVVLLTACSPWLPWSSRFSLRTLLLAMTLVAFVLG